MINIDKEYIKAKARLILQSQGELEAAEFLALTLFKNKKDKGGHPYTGHLERVANGMNDVDLRPAGWLHDLVEDIEGWEFSDLEDIGFSPFVIDAVRAVSKMGEDVPYFDEMVRVGLTRQAILLKRSDLKDNSNLLRLDHLPTQDDFERVRKYWLSDRYLEDVYDGRCMPGTPFIHWMLRQPVSTQDEDLLKKESRHPDVLALNASTKIIVQSLRPS